MQGLVFTLNKLGEALAEAERVIGEQVAYIAELEARLGAHESEAVSLNATAAGSSA